MEEIISPQIREILKTVDHTLLSPTATESEVRQLCRDGLRFRTASVCVAPAFVRMSRDFCGKDLPVCTVIGFPNGYATSPVKCFETADAIRNGADEVDMVVNLGWVKEGKYEAVLEEINAVKEAAEGRILKVIVETCLLTEAEKIRMCEVVSASDADFIKTSTGFSKVGATRADIALFRAQMTGKKKIKAAGGIASLSDARDFLALGADRLGTSRIVRLVKEGIEKAQRESGKF